MLDRAKGAVRTGLNKVRGAAKALGAKLRNSKLGKALANSARKVRERVNRLRNRWKERQRRRAEQRRRWEEQRNSPQSDARRLLRAVSRIRPRLNRLLQRGLRENIARPLLAALRAWYRLTTFERNGSPQFTMEAKLRSASAVVTRGFREVLSDLTGTPVARGDGGRYGGVLFLQPRTQARTPASEKDVAKPDDDSVVERWRRGMAAITRFASVVRQGGVSTRQLFTFLATVARTFRFKEIRARRAAQGWQVYARMNPDNSGNLVPFTGKVLLVGEGNLSFTETNLKLGIALPGQVTATVYKKRHEVTDPATLRRAGQLASAQVTVEFGVDATKLHEGAEDKPKFDTIIWMFPHPGGERAGATGRARAMLSVFFTSARTRLNAGGKIIVALRVGKRNYYERQWKPEKLANDAGLRLVSKTGFDPEGYRGYTHETTEAGAATVDVSLATTYIFTTG